MHPRSMAPPTDPPASSLPPRPADAVLRLRGPGGERLQGVAAGVQPRQHRAQGPRPEAGGVLRAAGKGAAFASLPVRGPFKVKWIQCAGVNRSEVRKVAKTGIRACV